MNRLVLLFICAIIGLWSCKKKDNVNTNTNNTTVPPCIVETNTMWLDDVRNEFTHDTSYVNGDTLLTTELEVSAGNGCVIRFSTQSTPAIGKYTVTDVIGELKTVPNTTYIQVFSESSPRFALSGTIEVYQNGNKLSVKGCGLVINNPIGDHFKLDFNGNL